MEKKILLIACLLIFGIVGVSVADQTVTFIWETTETVDGFRLFQRQQSGEYNYSVPVWEGVETTTKLTIPNGDYAFVVRAFIGSQESLDSNEVLFSVSPEPDQIVVPGRPKSFTITFETPF